MDDLTQCVTCDCFVENDKLRERITELEAENKELGDGIETVNNAGVETRRKLEAVIVELKELLIEYGRHQPGCPNQYDKIWPCRCGWKKVKQDLKGK